MSTLYWVVNGRKKWHAWPVGSHHSICGKLNLQHLREARDLKPQPTPPRAGDLCATCARKTGHAIAPRSSDAVTTEWVGLIRRHLKHTRVRAADATILLLAARLAEIGPPGAPATVDVFPWIKMLFLTPQARPISTRTAGKVRNHATLPYVRDALQKLPPNDQALLRIAATIKTWHQITQRDPSLDRFRVDRVVETILQIPTPEPYIRHLSARGLTHLASVFHPNTLERSKKDVSLRGLFGGAHDYWTETTEQLNVVVD